MSVLANAISEELELPRHHSERRAGPGKRRRTVTERNKVIAASTGAVVTSLTSELVLLSLGELGELQRRGNEIGRAHV